MAIDNVSYVVTISRNIAKRVVTFPLKLAQRVSGSLKCQSVFALYNICTINHVFPDLHPIEWNPVLTGNVHLWPPHDYNVCRPFPQGVVSIVLKIGHAPIAWYIL